MNWQPIETAPLDKQVMLWWVGKDRPEKVPASATIGCVSSFEEGFYWNGATYLPLTYITHWAPMPEGPSQSAGVDGG